MTLPANPTYPAIPSRRYSIGEIPFTPNEPIHNSTAHLRDFAAVCVANEATSNSTKNSGRMMVFNMLNANNWQNPFFTSTVILVLDWLALELLRGSPHQPENVMMGVVGDILTLITSQQICIYPELHTMVPPNALNVSHRNAAELENRRNMIAQYLGKTQTYSNHPQQQQYYHGQQPTQYTSQVQQYHPPVQQPIQQNVGDGRYSERSYSDDAYQTNAPMTRPQFEQKMVQETSQYFDAVYEPVNEVQHQAPPKESVNYVDPGRGVEQMDRSKHVLGEYSDIYRGNRDELRQSYNDSIEKVLDSVMVAGVESDGAIETKADVNSTTAVYPILEAASNIHEAIYLSRDIQMQVHSGSAYSKIFKTHLALYSPFIIGKEHLDDYLVLQDCKTFADLETTIKGLLQANPSAEQRAFCLMLDKRVTKSINDFIKRRMRLDLKIGSIAEDGADIVKYISDKYPSLADNIQEYERVVVGDLFLMHTDDIYGELAEMCALTHNAIFIHSKASITLLPINSYELDYGIEEQEKEIDPNATPMLQEVGETLRTHATQFFGTNNSIEDYIVTTDNEIYRIYEDLQVANRLFIYKV